MDLDLFKEKFEIKHGVKLYKKDLFELERLLKHESDKSNDNENSIDIKFYYRTEIKKGSKNSKHVMKFFRSPSEMTVEDENTDIDFLYIEKTVTDKEGSIIKSIDIKVNKSYSEVSLMGDESWVDFQSYLIEKFLSKRRSTLGKYNFWIGERLHWYSSALAGILGGFGFGFNNLIFIFTAALILILSGIISYPALKHKLFPLNEISLSETNESEKLVKRESKIRKRVKEWLKEWVREGIKAIVFGLIVYFLTKYIG